VTALVRSELLKLRTTKTALGLIVGMVGLIVLFTVLGALLPKESVLVERKNEFEVLANGSIASAFAAILGLMSMTAEFRHGTIRPTMLAAPRRVRVLVAKLVATTAAGAVLGLLGIALSYAIGRICLDARGIPSNVTSSDVRLMIVGSVAVSALWGAFGVGLGAVIRNQAGALVGTLMWVLLAESILFALVPSVGRFLPATAANVLTQIEVDHQLPVVAGVLVFCAYVAVAAVAGAFVTTRRDLA
jgi:ABC-type transport system involved in multi-copper enzyme maturation permease subunit